MSAIRSVQRVAPTASAAEQPDGLDEAALLAALRALRNGDLKVRLPDGGHGIAGAVAETFNDIVELNQRTAQELQRVSRAVGREGRIRHRVSIGPAGSWARNEAQICVESEVGDTTFTVRLPLIMESLEILEA